MSLLNTITLLRFGGPVWMSSSTESVVLVSAVLHAICGQGGDEFEVLKPNEILERVEFMTKAISTSRTDHD